MQIWPGALGQKTRPAAYGDTSPPLKQKLKIQILSSKQCRENHPTLP